MTVYEEFARSIPGFLAPQPGQLSEPFPKPLPDSQPTLLQQSDVHVGDTHKVDSTFVIFSLDTEPIFARNNRFYLFELRLSVSRKH